MLCRVFLIGGWKMTAGKAVEMCDSMRPNNELDTKLKWMWLQQMDARLRQTVVQRAACSGFFDAVGADVAGNDMGSTTRLLMPDAFAAAYQHWLCGQVDLALGETGRAANELQMYSDYVQAFAVWMRRKYAPTGGAQWSC